MGRTMEMGRVRNVGDEQTPDTKRLLRDAMRSTLRAMTSEDRRAASAAACDRVLAMPAYRNATTVMAYLPLTDELDCEPLLAEALRVGKTVCVPVVDWNSRRMRAVRLRSLAPESLNADSRGIRTPRVVDELAIEKLQLVIVPGLAFDQRGGRLGRGGGFYDRFLARLPASSQVVGLAFEWQIVGQILREPHDASVARIATESRVIDCV